MSNRFLGLVLAAVGVVMLLAVFFGDQIGIGAGFGVKHILGLMVGAAATVVGLVISRRQG